MSYFKEFDHNNTSQDSLFSGSTRYEGESSDSYYDDLLISEASKKLRVDELASKSHIDQRKLLWKIDLHVVPPFAMVFFLAYLNRSFGLLQIENIYPSLKINQLQFFMSYVAFFVPYIICQFFCNNLFAFVKPHGFMSLGILLYGAVTLATGFVKSYPAFVGCQFLHGLFQSNSEAAIFYILAHYYDKRESQARFIGIFSCSCLSGVFGNLIASLVNQRLAPHTFDGWRFLLIIEGSITIGCSVLLFFIIPDFPEGASFLNDVEAAFLIKKLELYHGKSGYHIPITFKRVLKSCADPVIWLPAIASMGIAYVTLAYSLFSPVYTFMIVEESIADSNRYQIFPWVAAFIWSNFSSYVSTKWFHHHHFGFFVLNLGVLVAGGAMMYVTPQSVGFDKIKYAGEFLCVMGSYTVSPILICWSSMNLGGHLRRSIAIAFQMSCMSAGGLIAIFMFYDNNLRYSRGFIGGFALALSSLVFVIGYVAVIKKMNLRKRTTEYKKDFFSRSETDQISSGDKNPSLDYLY